MCECMTGSTHILALLAVSSAWQAVPASLPSALCEMGAGPPPCAPGMGKEKRAAGAAMQLRGGSTYFADDPQKSLWYAAMLGDVSACERLLRQGADPNKLCHYDDEDGEDGPDAQAQRFASQFSPPGQCRTTRELTPNALHMACIGGYDSIVELLLQVSDPKRC